MKTSLLTIGILYLVALSPFSLPVQAATEQTSQGEDLPLLNKEQENKIDETKDKASAVLLGAADWIDSFFDDRRSTSEENQTRATAKLSTGYSRKDELELKLAFNLRLKLPRLSSRALLLIEGSDDSDFDADSTPIDNPSSHEDSKYQDLTVGLRHFLKESEKYNISLDTGLGWGYLYAGVRLRALQDFDEWQGRLVSRLRYYTDDGWESKTSYDLETWWGEKWMFRSTSTVILSEDEDGIPHSQYFKLFQVLNEYRVLSYESGIFLNTEPDYQVDDLQFIVKLRQRFYRDWLVLEVSPRVSFPEDYDYKFNPGIIFKLEATFGYDSDTEVYKSIFERRD